MITLYLIGLVITTIVTARVIVVSEGFYVDTAMDRLGVLLMGFAAGMVWPGLALALVFWLIYLPFDWVLKHALFRE